MTQLSTPFPTLDLEADMAWHWPQPPFLRRPVSTTLDTGEQACRIETPAGTAVEGLLVGFDTHAGLLSVRMRADGEPVSLPFSRIRRLTLVTPWSIAQRMSGMPVERAPNVVHERAYRVDLVAGGHLTGRTLGRVKQACGAFLFAPTDAPDAVLRVFVPAAVIEDVSFGPSAEEEAAQRWITSREQLVAALDAQRTAKIRPLGQALLDLGLLTQVQLARALEAQRQEREAPLGELLVAQGQIDRADLQTALAYKMGYPLVDLSRFPLDQDVARKLPQAVLIEFGLMPLMQLGNSLVVAIDDLARVAHLQASKALLGLKLVPVMACRSRIALALSALPQRLGTDRWSDDSVEAGRRSAFGSQSADAGYGRLTTY